MQCKSCKIDSAGTFGSVRNHVNVNTLHTTRLSNTLNYTYMEADSSSKSEAENSGSWRHSSVSVSVSLHENYTRGQPAINLTARVILV